MSKKDTHHVVYWKLNKLFVLEVVFELEMGRTQIYGVIHGC